MLNFILGMAFGVFIHTIAIAIFDKYYDKFDKTNISCEIRKNI
jgi:hypothetical protein